MPSMSLDCVLSQKQESMLSYLAKSKIKNALKQNILQPRLSMDYLSAA